jgi:anti-anti-sigma factor
MFEMFNNKYNSKKSLISQRILDNYQSQLEELYSYKILTDIDAIIVKINMERAVIENSESFREIMKTILVMTHKHYILDLTSALFMDSTFLGSLVMTLKQIHSKGSRLSVILDLEKIKILAPFEQLKRMLNTYNSCEEALSNLKS